MRTGTGTNQSWVGGYATSGEDRLHSWGGGSWNVSGDASNAKEQVNDAAPSKCDNGNFTIQPKTWFESVENTGCVDGVCPVPWAVSTSPIAPKGDPVDHPEHYTAGKVEVIEILEQAVEDAPDPISGGLLWQTLKYLLRLWYKGNTLQDAKKARWYLNRLIDRLERDYV